MLGRYSYAGAVGLLLTLACGPQVEIGHGSAAGSGNGGANGFAGTGAAVGGGSSEDGGAPPEALGGSIGNFSGNGPVPDQNQGGTTYGGPIPIDNGPQAETGKVDLLLAVDNSISMADKQKLFAKAVPELVKRLVNPRCVSTKGQVVSEPATPTTACPAGSQREYEPLRDLHVGVITSSLGSHGAPGTKDVCVQPEDDDHAHLIPSVRPSIDSYDGQGYLNWDPDGSSNPPGETDAQAFADALGSMIVAAGEHGCGYEAQLESVYRFLVDPDPPQSVTLQGATTVKVGTDAALLKQRANFLRADSSVVVLLLTDENDCSILDESYGWLVPRASAMYRSTSQCAANSNDACCQSCAEQKANPGCPDIQADSECVKGNTLDTGSDDLNLRCWEQKRRFGFDLLYPTSRYVSGFGDGDVPDRNGQLVPNPLFHRGKVDRDRSLFTLSVIGGVPWQDLATTATLQGDTLEYMTSEQLTTAKRWATILGDPDHNVPPTDPFMHEQPNERTGQNPITGDKLVASTSTNPLANAINGHEQVNVGNSDLQYACTFPLPEPKTCDEAADIAGEGCDCFAADAPFDRPVCNPPGGGQAGIKQYYGKAYPTLREFAVAQELGRRSVLGSICARNTQDDTRSDYGYRPVFDAIGRRVASTLVKP